MCNQKLRVPQEDGTMNTYTCQEVRLLFKHWIGNFATKNRSHEIKVDRHLEEYKNQFRDFFSKCNDKINPESEVSKNIREARERRFIGDDWETM